MVVPLNAVAGSAEAAAVADGALPVLELVQATSRLAMTARVTTNRIWQARRQETASSARKL